MTEDRTPTQAADKGSDKKPNYQNKLDWTEVTPGATILTPGNSVDYQTGDWRSERPVIDFSKCIHCLFCYAFCPDGAIITENQKVVGVDYFHCKGCGICTSECPVKCIAMVDESKALKAEELAESSGKGAR